MLPDGRRTVARGTILQPFIWTQSPRHSTPDLQSSTRVAGLGGGVSGERPAWFSESWRPATRRRRCSPTF